MASVWELMRNPEDYSTDLAVRKARAQALEQRINSLPEEQSGVNNVNLKPLIAWTDSINRTNLASSYESPEIKQDQMRMKLEDQLRKETEGVADDQFKLMDALRKQEEFDERMDLKEKFLSLYGDKNAIAKDKADAAAAKPEKLPEGAYQAAGFAKRLQQSEEVVNDLLKSGYQGPSRKDQVTSFLPNEVQSKAFQKYDQAARNFINATLRRESGASIAQSEFDNAYKQYLPKPGDTPEVLAQKAANRRQVFENFKSEGRSAFDAIPYVSPVKAQKNNVGLAASSKVKVRKGNEVLEIDRSDLNSAIKDGYSEVK